MKRDQMPGAALTFVLGAAAGAAVALLFARKSGEELRRDIAEGVSDGVDQLRSTGKDLQRRAHKVVDVAKEQAQDALEAGGRAYSHAKNA
jgi:gas vesicle protein